MGACGVSRRGDRVVSRQLCLVRARSVGRSTFPLSHCTPLRQPPTHTRTQTRRRMGLDEPDFVPTPLTRAEMMLREADEFARHVRTLEAAVRAYGAEVHGEGPAGGRAFSPLAGAWLAVVGWTATQVGTAVLEQRVCCRPWPLSCASIRPPHRTQPPSPPLQSYHRHHHVHHNHHHHHLSPLPPSSLTNRVPARPAAADARQPAARVGARPRHRALRAGAPGDLARPPEVRQWRGAALCLCVQSFELMMLILLLRLLPQADGEGWVSRGQSQGLVAHQPRASVLSQQRTTRAHTPPPHHTLPQPRRRRV